MSGTDYKSKRRDISERFNLYQQRCDNLKSQMNALFFW
jgi:hypothetical protein